MAERQGAKTEGGFRQKFPAAGNSLEPATMSWNSIHLNPHLIDVGEFIEIQQSETEFC
jgi:hypothetical protein